RLLVVTLSLKRLCQIGEAICQLVVQRTMLLFQYRDQFGKSGLGLSELLLCSVYGDEMLEAFGQFRRIAALGTLVDSYGALKHMLGFGMTPHLVVESCQFVQRVCDFGTASFILYVENLQEQWLGIGEALLPDVDFGDAIEARHKSWIFFAVLFFLNGDKAFEVWLRFVVSSKRVIDIGEISECGGNLGMLGAECAFGDRMQALEDRE